MTDAYTQVRNVCIVSRDFLILVIKALYFYSEAIFRCFVKPPLKSLAGEVILITGAANGIGRKTALLLANSNAKIVCWDLNKKESLNLVKELQASGCEAYSFEVNVADRHQVEAAAIKVQQTIGDVSILINNAGIMPCKKFLKHSPEELEKVFQVNVFGNFWTLRAFLPKMLFLNKGHIVTLCSAAGILPCRNLAAYCGTKHAIHGVIEGIKDEFRNMEKRPNINFTTVYPYSCSTGLLTGVKSYSRFPWLIPTVLRPEDVARRVVEGLRRNYEHVYIPYFVQFGGTTAKALLPNVQIAATEFLKCYVEPSDN